MSQSAAKKVRNEKTIPVHNMKAIETRKTRFAPQISFSATRSAVMMEIATGTPACETVIARK